MFGRGQRLTGLQGWDQYQRSSQWSAPPSCPLNFIQKCLLQERASGAKYNHCKMSQTIRWNHEKTLLRLSQGHLILNICLLSATCCPSIFFSRPCWYSLFCFYFRRGKQFLVSGWLDKTSSNTTAGCQCKCIYLVYIRLAVSALRYNTRYFSDILDFWQ